MLKSPTAPSSLSSLIPLSVSNVATYGLRNANHIRTLSFKTQHFAASFIPSSISEWNKLPSTTRSADTIFPFKHALNSNKKTVPKHYFDGKRDLAIQHARLRMHCSSLNEHLFSKTIVESPASVCGEIEDTYHYIFTFPLYDSQRSRLFDVLRPIASLDLNTVLFGNDSLSDDVNQQIFRNVPTYISKTKRFIYN